VFTVAGWPQETTQETPQETQSELSQK